MKDVIKRFFNNKADKEDIRKIFEWFFDQDAGSRILRDLESTSFNNNDTVENWEPKSDFNRIREQLKEDKREKSRRFMNFNVLIRYAAILLVVSTISFALYELFVADEIRSTNNVQLITKSTESGQKLTVFLPDGSKAILNSNSSIRYNSTFNLDATRQVHVLGEVFFDVTHNDHKPFIVQAKNVNVTALGTSFNVSTRKEKLKVALVNGKVKVVTQSGETMHLHSGEMAIIYNGGVLQKSFFNSMVETGWIRDQLVFSNSPFNELIETLEEWYGVEIDLRNMPSDLATHYSGNFKNKSLKEVLDGIGYTYDFSFELQANKVIIKFNKNETKTMK